jgi:hypothetical protein
MTSEPPFLLKEKENGIERGKRKGKERGEKGGGRRKKEEK